MAFIRRRYLFQHSLVGFRRPQNPINFQHGIVQIAVAQARIGDNLPLAAEIRNERYASEMLKFSGGQTIMFEPETVQAPFLSRNQTFHLVPVQVGMPCYPRFICYQRSKFALVAG